MCLASITMAYNLSCSSNMANMTLLHLMQIVADLKIIMCSIYMTEEAERACMRMMRRMQVGYNVYYHSGSSNNCDL